MADAAHDSSASPKPSDVARQQASRPDSPDKGKLRVFISYSREDLDFADQLYAALNACGFECAIDRHGIVGGEEWERRLGNLISEADTVVFVLSPTSACSKYCAWEVEEAARLSKRILPVNCRPLEGVTPPPRLRELNYIFFHADSKNAPGSGFGTGLAKLVAALNTDFDWLREHTRYLQRATEWDSGGQLANRLLSGDDIAEAKAWLARRPKSAPEPTSLHLDFIRASEEEAVARLSEQRKQLEAVAASQVEREKALHQAEEALRKRATMAKVRNIAFMIVSILAVVTAWLYRDATQQRKVAEAQKEQADEILGRAVDIIGQSIFASITEMDAKTMKLVFALFQAGADHGDAASMQYLGTAYENGQGVAQDLGKAREWYEKAIAKDNSDAMNSLGMLYQNGEGVTQDFGKAREWYEKAIAKDNSDAMMLLGSLYQNGQGVTQDFGKAREWFEKAAAKGGAIAMANLGLLYQNGQGVAQDYSKARELYEKAAAMGQPMGMLLLGELYENGQGVTQDYPTAREWYEKAAAKGDAYSMYLLGKLYYNGQGVAQDYAKAREWFEKAAAKGEQPQPEAMISLGTLYDNGQGVTQDYPKAREWYEKAREWYERTAAKGEPGAMHRLGLLYEKGRGVPRDYDKAHEWYEKAAEMGDAPAMVNLGQLYLNGDGVPRDYAKAREWFEKAAAKGNATAKNLLKQLPSEAARSGVQPHSVPRSGASR
jgi:TPR repeat protein